MPADDSEALWKVRDGLDVMGQRFERMAAAFADAREPVSGSDPGGLATISLDGDNQVVGLAFSQAHLRGQRPDKIAAAVAAAYTDALARRSAMPAPSLEGAGDAPDLRPRPGPLAYETPSRRMHDYVEEQGGSWASPIVTARVQALIDESYELTQLVWQEVPKLAQARASGRHGAVTVTVSLGGHPASITFDERLTPVSSATSLATDFMTALREAQSRLPQMMADVAPSIQRFQALQDQLHDPAALAERLGVFEPYDD